MFNRKSLLTVSGALLGLVVAVASAGAWVNTSSRMSYLTFSGPVSLPGVTLGTGTYVFELNGNTSLNQAMVRVLNKNRSIVFYTGFTLEVRRPKSLPARQQISFGETPAGVAPPITVWYPLGDAAGRQFIYAKR